MKYIQLTGTLLMYFHKLEVASVNAWSCLKPTERDLIVWDETY